MKCASCGTESDGRFCPSCGAPLEPGHCRECGASLVPGARFCTRCGTAAGGRATSRNPNTPWYIAGGVMLVLIAILVVPMLSQGDDAAPVPPPVGAAGSPPPLTGTPRQNADRLFERIMTASERGDTAEALRFAPMGIAAYEMAAPLDADGLYHLATVQIVARDFDGARVTAERMLDDNPDHLLGLAAAAEAAERAGDPNAAREYYQRFLDAYDSQMESGLQEYRDHARSFPLLRQMAERATGG